MKIVVVTLVSKSIVEVDVMLVAIDAAEVDVSSDVVALNPIDAGPVAFGEAEVDNVPFGLRAVDMSSLNTRPGLGVGLVDVMLELLIAGSEPDVREPEKPVTSGLTNEDTAVEVVAL